MLIVSQEHGKSGRDAELGSGIFISFSSLSISSTCFTLSVASRYDLVTNGPISVKYCTSIENDTIHRCGEFFCSPSALRSSRVIPVENEVPIVGGHIAPAIQLAYMTSSTFGKRASDCSKGKIRD